MALTLGILLGLICGIQYTRRTVLKNKLSKENMKISKNKAQLNNGIVNEEINKNKKKEKKANGSLGRGE